MIRLSRITLVVVFSILAMTSVVWAQSSDQRLVGTWSGKEANEQFRVIFHADGTLQVNGQNDSMTGTYKADFSKTPGTLLLKRGQDGEERASLIEFVDDNHIRVSEPGDTSMNEGSTMILERVLD